MTAMQRSQRLIESLLQPEVWPDGVTAVTLIETHISWVLLTGEWAFKIRKPLDLGFLDFSTLARRDHCAHEELRLNRRFAPEIYDSVIRITGAAERPTFDESGPLIEVAVKMRQFDTRMQLDALLAAGQLRPADMLAVAGEIAAFQLRAARSEVADGYGTPAAVMAPVRENFQQLRAVAADLAGLVPMLAGLEALTEQWALELEDAFLERRAAGFIREGHGDLHLANLTRLPAGIRAFDCIEFSPALRWIDVISDLAFLFMDLCRQERADLAWVLVNGWLLHSGDYRGITLLKFYGAYRALVRAKVAAFRRRQVEAEGRDPLEQELFDYLALARAFSQPAAPQLLLTCGVSGSGKSWLGSQLAATLGCVHLRSDVERKRLFGLRAEQPSDSAQDAGIYTAAASELTYRHLYELGDQLLSSGQSVLLDATALTRTQRAPFIALARKHGLTLKLLYLTCNEATLYERIRQRRREAVDPSEADETVLQGQLQRLQPPREDEGAMIIGVNGEAPPSLAALAARLAG